MSVEAFKAFGKKCAEDKAVRAEAKKIGITNLAGLVGYGKKLGFDFSVADIKTLGKQISGGEGELSEKDLEKVAGGFVTTTAAVVAEAVTTAALGGAAVATAAHAW